MDRLELRLTEFEDFIDIVVNGVNFLELVADVERELDPTLAGSYGGFPWSLMTSSWSNVFDAGRGSGAPIVLVCE